MKNIDKFIKKVQELQALDFIENTKLLKFNLFFEKGTKEWTLGVYGVAYTGDTIEEAMEKAIDYMQNNIDSAKELEEYDEMWRNSI